MKFAFNGPLCKVGQRVQLGAEPSIYIIASVDLARVALIDIETGHRWKNPVVVEDIFHITREEWKELAGYCYDEYKVL